MYPFERANRSIKARKTAFRGEWSVELVPCELGSVLVSELMIGVSVIEPACTLHMRKSGCERLISKALPAHEGARTMNTVRATLAPANALRSLNTNRSTCGIALPIQSPAAKKMNAIGTNKFGLLSPPRSAWTEVMVEVIEGKTERVTRKM